MQGERVVPSHSNETEIHMLLPSLLLTARPPPPPPDGQPTTPVLATASPLIGAPRFLRLHVKLQHEGTVYDFVPRDPRSPATLGALLSGRAVDGEIRVMPARPEPDESWRVVGHTALTNSEFKESVLERAAPPPQLSLLGNNCWSFATSVLQSNCLEKPS